MIKRKFYLFKCRARVILRRLTEKVLFQLSEWGWIYYHNASMSNITDNGEIQHYPEITTDRYIFSVSYVVQKYERKVEKWFHNKKGKVLYTIEDTHHIYGVINCRAELKAFLCHFSPKQRMWVDYTQPTVQFLEEDMEAFDFSENLATRPVKVVTHRCDFSQCRYAFKFNFDFCPDKEVPPEVISQSYRALEVQLRSKQTEINKILTGADHDGEMMSHKNMPLSDNLLCRHCGLPVFASAEHKYDFECLKHGELNFGQVVRVDPVEYKRVMEYTIDILDALIKKKTVRQDSNL